MRFCPPIFGRPTLDCRVDASLWTNDRTLISDGGLLIALVPRTLLAWGGEKFRSENRRRDDGSSREGAIARVRRSATKTDRSPEVGLNPESSPLPSAVRPNAGARTWSTAHPRSRCALARLALYRTGSWSIRATQPGSHRPYCPTRPTPPTQHAAASPRRRCTVDPHGFARQPPRPAARSASLNTSRRKHPIRASRDRELWADLDDS
jgi:hypothetical protein